MKRNIALLLVMMLIFGLLTGCATSKTTAESTPTETPTLAAPASVTPESTAVPKSDASELDGTYWCWMTGVTIGSAFWVQFHGDGTMDTLNVNYDSPDDVISVPYTYENGVLTIGPSSVYSDSCTYHRTEKGGFESDVKVQMQSELAPMTFTPDEYQNFSQVEKLDALYYNVLMKGVWYHPASMNLGATRTVFQEGYRAERYGVTFAYDEDYEHVVSYSYAPTETAEVAFRFFDGTIDNMTYDPKLDVLYYTWENDISGDVMVEYLIHYDSDPDIDTLMRDYQYYTSTEMSIRPQK